MISDGDVGSRLFGLVLGHHHSEYQATEHGPNYFFKHDDFGTILGQVIFDNSPVMAVSAAGIGPVYLTQFWGVIILNLKPGSDQRFVMRRRRFKTLQKKVAAV